MTNEYTYERILTNNAYDIDNPLRIDESGEQICLAKEVESSLPGKKFKLRCNHTEAKFIFEVELTPEEKTILDGKVINHKNNI